MSTKHGMARRDFQPGDQVFYCDSFTEMKNADVEHGARGDVVAVIAGEAWAEIQFEGSDTPVACAVGDLRLSPPPLPGGFRLSEPVYYCGASEAWDDGDRLEYGARGEIAGMSDDDRSVEVSFPGNKDVVDCLLTDLSRTWPPVEPVPPSGSASRRLSGAAAAASAGPSATQPWHAQLFRWMLGGCCSE
jgi:hypothetical protein